VYSKVYAVTPDPIIEYQLGPELQGVYQPKAFANCWVTSMGNQNYYIGPFIPDSNTYLIVVRFLSKQYPVGMGRYTQCEAPTNVSAEERAEWLMARNSNIVRGKVKIYYVDGAWSQVTLTPTMQNNSTVTPTLQYTVIPTYTPIPAPNPTVFFQTKDGSDALDVFIPVKNTICWTWHQPTGRIGPYTIPKDKQLLVIKFLEPQGLTLVNTVACEVSESIKPEERASWSNSREPGYYPWSRIVTYYVDGNMAVVTLTQTPSTTLTPSNTPFLTETNTSTVTFTSTPTPSRTASNTATETETSSATVTNTATSSRTSTRTATVTNTPTATPALVPDKIVPINVSALFIPKTGDICYGQIVGGLRNNIVEFVADFQAGIEISGGGCFTSKYYSLGQILRYLESRGIRYGYESLPKPTLTPSRTLIPTATIVRYLAIGLNTDGIKSVVIEAGTVCWGAKVGSIEYKVVRFQRSLSTPISITKGGCTYGQNLSAEDVFNYLRRVFNTPLSGFVDVR
jgi:hypothetical protein